MEEKEKKSIYDDKLSNYLYIYPTAISIVIGIIGIIADKCNQSVNKQQEITNIISIEDKEDTVISVQW